LCAFTPKVVGPTHIERLMKAMAQNEQSKHLLLGNNIVGPRGCAAIAKHVRQQQTDKPPAALLETLYLAGNEVDAAGAKELANALKDDKHVHSLWLKRNPIGSGAGIRAIAEMLAINTRLEVLDLDNCGLLDDGLEILVRDGLKHNTTLKHLYLNSNGLTARGGCILANYFMYKAGCNEPGIVSLWVGVNRMDDAGVQALVRGAATYAPLQRLTVSSNRFGAETARVIRDCFSAHPTLTALDVGFYKSTLDLVRGGTLEGEHSLVARSPLSPHNIACVWPFVLGADAPLIPYDTSYRVGVWGKRKRTSRVAVAHSAYVLTRAIVCAFTPNRENCLIRLATRVPSTWPSCLTPTHVCAAWA
jgi:hypothetical protein